MVFLQADGRFCDHIKASRPSLCCCPHVSAVLCAVLLQGCAVGGLLEDVGCLFLLDMLLGNADRMPCADLGWRGNANNLLYGAPGGWHSWRCAAATRG
jgi:hypothetical protein